MVPQPGACRTGRRRRPTTRSETFRRTSAMNRTVPPEDLSGWTALDIGSTPTSAVSSSQGRGACVTGLDVDDRYLAQARWAARAIRPPSSWWRLRLGADLQPCARAHRRALGPGYRTEACTTTTSTTPCCSSTSSSGRYPPRVRRATGVPDADHARRVADEEASRTCRSTPAPPDARDGIAEARRFSKTKVTGRRRQN